jgi:hypothetical protein
VLSAVFGVFFLPNAPFEFEASKLGSTGSCGKL